MNSLAAIYNAATATIKAPIAPTKEPVRTLAALVETTPALVEVLEPELVAVAKPDDDKVPTVTVLLLPEAPVGEDPEPVPVTEALTPLPAPMDGESPLPEDTTAPELAAATRDEATLAYEAEADASELPPADEVLVAVEDLLLDELPEETSLQDKS